MSWTIWSYFFDFCSGWTDLRSWSNRSTFHQHKMLLFEPQKKKKKSSPKKKIKESQKIWQGLWTNQWRFGLVPRVTDLNEVKERSFENFNLGKQFSLQHEWSDCSHTKIFFRFDDQKSVIEWDQHRKRWIWRPGAIVCSAPDPKSQPWKRGLIETEKGASAQKSFANAPDYSREMK